MPSSRTATVVIARDVKHALTIEKATMAGVKNCAAVSPPWISDPNMAWKTNMKMSGNANVKKAAAGLRQNARFS